MSAPRAAVFLDRDGTLNREVDYLSDPEDFELLAGAAEGLRRLASAGYALVVVTNQSGIARGLFDLERLEAIHARMRAELQQHGITLQGVYACPHLPEITGACECRKPLPGLFERAILDLALDPERSFVIGDSERDLAAGAALGIPGVLVATGKGTAEYERLRGAKKTPVPFVPDLAAAASWILRGGQSS